MKIDKLIPMVEFVLQEEAYINQFNTRDARTADPYNRIVNYAKFLSQPLQLGMFVPCDDEGKYLINPDLPAPFCRDCADENGTCPNSGYPCEPKEATEVYSKAKEKVLFKGFEVLNTRVGMSVVNNGRLEFEFDEYGCWLNPYDSCDGVRINKIEILSNLNLSKEHLTLTRNAIKQIYGG